MGFENRNPHKRCHGPTIWNVDKNSSQIIEDLASAGKEWQYFENHTTPQDYKDCEKCLTENPPCYSVAHCQRNVLKLYNNPYILPWKRSVHLTFNEPSFHVMEMRDSYHQDTTCTYPNTICYFRRM